VFMLNDAALFLCIARSVIRFFALRHLAIEWMHN
jgi:hypothetical protein